MTFEAYTADRFIEVVKAWVDHPWPISADEGRRLFEDLGYVVDSEDPEMFLSEFASNGEADSYFTVRDGTVGTVDISVTKYYNTDDTTVDATVGRGQVRAVLRCRRSRVSRHNSPKE